VIFAPGANTNTVAEHIAASLEARGIKTWLYTNWGEDEVAAHVPAADMVVAIGGDGAMLRAARVCAPHGVPVLGVNMGHLGFLTEVSGPEQWPGDLDRVLEGSYWIEQRMMVGASVLRQGESIASGQALNDVVISGSVVGRMIRLETYIDAGWATTYNADALIIATATGSTAYALACGGPILPPELRNILIVPAAPHLSMNRPIVLSEGATVEIVATSYGRGEVVVLVDGTALSTLGPDDAVRIHASDHVSRFVRLRERNYFYRSLLDRLEPRIPRSGPEDRQRTP
jgi:NAD+ kinase